MYVTIFDRIHKEHEKDVRVVRERYIDHYVQDGERGIRLARRELLRGYSVFRVGGKLTTKCAPNYGNFVALNPREAKRRFKDLYGWEGLYVRKITDPTELEEILTDWRKFPL